ncbi:MAG TPA: hypothetical protein VJJ72_01995 [Candidatus Paceibacterota bacterium]
MGYILGILIILGIIFYTGSDFSFTNPGNLLGQIKDKSEEYIFPKSDKEILIENLQEDYKNLEQFFQSEAPQKLLQSNTLTPSQKETLQKALDGFKATKQSLEEVKKKVIEEKSIPKIIFEKILSFDQKKTPQEEQGLEPTYIPPQCRVTCPAD